MFEKEFCKTSFSSFRQFLFSLFLLVVRLTSDAIKIEPKAVDFRFKFCEVSRDMLKSFSLKDKKFYS